MSNVESWLILALCFGVIYLAVSRGGVAFDRMLDALWGEHPNKHQDADPEKPCPCSVDPLYHRKMGGL